MGFLDNIPKVTRNLLLINIILFVATWISEDFMVRTFAMFYPASPLFRPWQVITHMFMHGGFWHLFFNMYSLWMFGSLIERQIGFKKFITFYFICGLGAAAMHTGVEWLSANTMLAAGNNADYTQLLYTPVLGASGAIYGLLIGFAMIYPDARLTLIFPPITLGVKWWVGIFIAIELFTGITGTAMGIAHFAHLGGALLGFLLMMFWKKSHRLWDKDKWF